MVMKVLHVVPSFGLGGMEKIICAIINHTYLAYRHQILSLDSNYDAFQWVKSDHVEKIKFSKMGGFVDFISNLHKIIRHLSPDLLMTYNWGAIDAIWIARFAGIKHIVHNEHGFSIEEAKTTLWKRDLCRLLVYRMASVLITVSSPLKASLRKRYWLRDKHIQVIPNGINPNYYSGDQVVRQHIRQELKLAEDDFVVVFSGRLDPVKNFDLLLDVFEHCHAMDSKVKLLIIGDGPERQRIEGLCLQKNMRHSVVMVGQKLEVLPYLRAGDVFLLTSLTEQMPLTILEAMSVGLPVIASDVGEIRHIIKDGTDGFLRDIRDGWEAFTSAVLRLKGSPEQQAMSEAARAKVVGGFHETLMGQRYEAIFDGLLGRLGRP